MGKGQGDLTKRCVHRHLNRGHEWVAVAALLPSAVSIRLAALPPLTKALETPNLLGRIILSDGYEMSGKVNRRLFSGRGTNEGVESRSTSNDGFTTSCGLPAESSFARSDDQSVSVAVSVPVPVFASVSVIKLQLSCSTFVPKRPMDPLKLAVSISPPGSELRCSNLTSAAATTAP